MRFSLLWDNIKIKVNIYIYISITYYYTAKSNGMDTSTWYVKQVVQEYSYDEILYIKYLKHIVFNILYINFIKYAEIYNEFIPSSPKSKDHADERNSKSYITVGQHIKSICLHLKA